MNPLIPTCLTRWVSPSMITLHFVVWVILTAALDQAAAATTPSSALKGIAVPATPGLLGGKNPVIVNKSSAIQLGKALFWDSAVGSDGMACASCHFHAGADRRTRNQLESGSRHVGAATSASFEKTPSGAPGGPNHALRSADFPMFRLTDPMNNKSAVLFSTDDVVSSSGTFLADFKSIDGKNPESETCDSGKDPVFHAGVLNTRRVSTRNAPSVFNAAYNHRNFWDGRANNLFNGESAFGARDPDAGVWEVRDGRTVHSKILLENASLASQAVAPPLDDREMSCRKRTFKDLGRKLLQRRPLTTQEIHPEDSSLSSLRDQSGKGLTTTYGQLIQTAFDKRFWSGQGDFGKPLVEGAPYSQMEANFAFFFGLAIQLYEATLISDESPFDAKRDPQGYPIGYTSEQKHGLDVFASECMLCHMGPTFTSAAHPSVYNAKNAITRWVDRRVINGDFDGDGVIFAMIDLGYTNTSVTPTDFDIGLGGTDPFGNPLSFSAQYQQTLLDPAKKMIDPVDIQACHFTTGYTHDFKADELALDPRGKHACEDYAETSRVPKPAVMVEELKKFEEGRAIAAVKGAFKIPGLRNVELTGPYMHNGSLKNLEEVMGFYDRGGNVGNPHHIGNLVFPRPFSDRDKSDLIAFLKTLTDERVRWERAPFDHPSLEVPHGHAEQPSPADPVRAADLFLHIPAVGRQGLDATQGPIKPFESYLAP